MIERRMAQMTMMKGQMTLVMKITIWRIAKMKMATKFSWTPSRRASDCKPLATHLVGRQGIPASPTSRAVCLHLSLSSALR